MMAVFKAKCGARVCPPEKSATVLASDEGECRIIVSRLATHWHYIRY